MFPQQLNCNFQIVFDKKEGLKIACAKIGNQKAPGSDGIPNVALKNRYTYVQQELTEKLLPY